MKLSKVYGYLKNDLAMIETALNHSIDSQDPNLQQASRQLLRAGGKRLRPIFVILSARMGMYNAEQVKIVAVSLELIHMASLVHDDVIDNANLRRGEPTVKYAYDNKVAMYMGDYVLARALEHMTHVRKPEAHQLLSQSIVELTRGEIQQIRDKYNWNQNLRHYLRRIKRKTALLIATSCKLGAIVADMSPADARYLFKFGYYIGMSYQIIDDILDFTSNESTLGKPAGNDLRQGHITLPVLYAMEDPEFKHAITQAFADSVQSNHLMEDLLVSLQQTQAIERSYQLSEMYLHKAQTILNYLPDSKAKETMQTIAHYIGHRSS